MSFYLHYKPCDKIDIRFDWFKVSNALSSGKI